MANYKFNCMIATHDDKSKVRDLYRFSYSENFFERIFPSPAEFIDVINEGTPRYRKAKKNSDKLYLRRKEQLYLWRKENWGTAESPYYELEDTRKLSKHGTCFTTYFVMRSVPPIKIYDELHRQGFRVKAYYIEPLGFHYCGSYIDGIHEHFEYMKPDQDVPPDIERCFNVKEWKELETPPGPPTKQTADDTHDEGKDLDKANKAKALSDSERDDENMAYFQEISEEINI